MKNLYFLNSNGEKNLVKESLPEMMIMPTITAYVRQLNPKYKIHYVRQWEENNSRFYDIGSHSEFFVYE